MAKTINIFLAYMKRPGLMMAAVLLLAGLVGACTQAPVASPPPTQQIIRVQLPAVLQPLTAGLQICAAAQPEAAVFVEEPGAGGAAKYDLVISLGEPAVAQAYAVALASEDLVIVANPKNTLDTLSAANLRSLFSGATTTWDSLGSPLGEVQVWDYPASSSMHQAFQRAVLKDGLVTPAITSLAGLAPTPAAMLEAVSSSPQALGYLPRAWLKGQPVHEIKVDADIAAALHLPILALADQEPQGALRTLVACLQTGKGQTSILEHYRPWQGSRAGKP